MMVIIAKQVIKPSCFERYHALAAELVEKSRVEAGCEDYRSVQSAEDARVHLFIEFWKDQDAIALHGATEHFLRIVPQFAEMFAEAETVTYYQNMV